MNMQRRITAVETGQVTVDQNVYISVNGGRRRLKVVQGGLNPDGLERVTPLHNEESTAAPTESV
jgi:hypothetical protein